MELAIGETHILKITDIAFGGEGVGRLGDFVVFVPFVGLDETIEARITEVKKRFARGKLERILEAGPTRVTPLCPYYGECGGCQYQHLEYSAQLEIKHKQACDLFERIGGLSRELIAPVVPCPAPYGYRNRIMIRSQWDKFKQGLNIGYVRADNRLVVDIEECKIAEPALSDQIKQVRANPPPKGGLKVVLRIPPEGWEVPRDSFFQNNFFLLPKLVQTVRERLVDCGTRHLVDVYCGVGFFSLELADSVETYAGLELDAMAIKAARRNAITRGRNNGVFVAGSAEEKLPELLKQTTPEASTVILDPPRKGCQPEIIELLRAVKPRQIIYVSCQPATMARDLNIMCGDGVFKVMRIVPLDMFPQTAHVECVADLRHNC
jgi:tRNA/tmRNA/rRNA uracil-C5-methylase (TrmA/RlmC/RlmD family)